MRQTSRPWSEQHGSIESSNANWCLRAYEAILADFVTRSVFEHEGRRWSRQIEGYNRDKADYLLPSLDPPTSVFIAKGSNIEIFEAMNRKKIQTLLGN